MAVDLREVVGGAARRQRDRAHRRPRQEYRQARPRPERRISVAEADPRRRAYGQRWCSTQLKRVLDAYAARDVEEAMEVWKRDEEIDAMCVSLFRELLTYMMEDPRNITFCIHLLFSAKNIERMGDHATNIAETVHYMMQGRAARRWSGRRPIPRALLLPRSRVERDADDERTERAHPRSSKTRSRCRCCCATISRPKATRLRRLGARRRCRYAAAGKHAGSGRARLDAARAFRHRAVPQAAYAAGDQDRCRSSC